LRHFRGAFRLHHQEDCPKGVGRARQ
jgi:hypothetical protein